MATYDTTASQNADWTRTMTYSVSGTPVQVDDIAAQVPSSSARRPHSTRSQPASSSSASR